MITKNILDYCTDYERIENYEKAIADTDNIWECHHRLEIMPFSNKTVSIDYLKKQGLYYKQSPNAFIFLTKQEHRKLHFTGNNFAKGENLGNQHALGNILSEEIRKQMGESRLGNSNNGVALIECLETKEVHRTREWILLGYRNAYQVASGRRKHCKGLHFVYV